MKISPAFESVEPRLLLANFVVTRRDDGPFSTITGLTLRQAIESANQSPGTDSITFAITDPASNVVQIIQPLDSALPDITEAVNLDARPPVDLPDQRIVLDGSLAPLGSSGLTFLAANNTVQGISVVGFRQLGISGEVSGGHGILLSSNNNLVVGNRIGNAPGFGPLTFNNDGGGLVVAGGSNTIGGFTPSVDRNVISGNTGVGILLPDSNASQNLIAGNFIGTDLTGTSGLPNALGILIQGGSALNRIVGGNVISGNAGDGIYVQLGNSTEISSNRIGLNAAGTALVGNGAAGIRVGLTEGATTIGGLTSGTANSIAGNGVTTVGGGVVVEQVNGIVPRVAILGNSIYSNSGTSGAGLGIDIGGDGVTSNRDSGSGLGSLEASNYPVFDAYTPGANSISGSLVGIAGTDYRLEFFLNDVANPSGYGEGLNFFSSLDVTTDISTGAARFTLNLPFPLPANQYLTATATSAFGATSEFSLAELLTSLPNLNVSVTAAPDPVFVDDLLSYTITVGNSGFSTASGVIVTDFITSAADFVGVDSAFPFTYVPPSTGAAQVIFDLGSLEPDQSVTMKVLVRPNVSGTYANTATATAKEADTDPADNSATVSSQFIYSFVVRNENDAGPFSFRRVIFNANRNPGLETITFAIPTASPVIQPLSPLPVLLGPTVVDGTSQPGFSGVPLVVLDGSRMAPTSASPANLNGLTLLSNNVVRGLEARSFLNSGFVIDGGVNNLIVGNFLRANLSNGLFIRTGGQADGINRDSRFNTIGGTTSSDRNLISNNSAVGILLDERTDATLILGNSIGTDPTGQAARGNGLDGILVNDASNTTIGGTAQGAGNFIAGSGEVNLQIFGPGATNTVVQGNRIGTNAAGTRILFPEGLGADGRTQVGILINGAPRSLIGGSTQDASNLIAGHDAGIQVFGSGAFGTRIAGNIVGADLSGSRRLPNGIGVLISGSSGNTIGGLTLGERNLLSGNMSVGVRISGPNASQNLVVGNLIGTDGTGQMSLGNGFDGVFIDNAADNTVGGSTTSAANVISGNRSSGIQLFGGGATRNQVLGNFIGPSASGTELGGDGTGPRNSAVGVFLNDAPGNTIGGEDPSAGNVIAYTTQVGVQLNGNLARGNLIARNTIRDNRDVGIAAQLGVLNTIPVRGPIANLFERNGQNLFKVPTAGPTVVGISTSEGTPSSPVVRLTFSRSLNPAQASDQRNYRIEVLNARGRVIGRITILSAQYDDASRSVILNTAPLVGGRRYLLTVMGGARRGLRDTNGKRLDGDLDGIPGGNFLTRLDAAGITSQRVAPRSGKLPRVKGSPQGPGSALRSWDRVALRAGKFRSPKGSS